MTELVVTNMIDTATNVVNQSALPDVFLEKLLALKDSLIQELPDIANAVKQVHKDLLASPELIHLMSPEEVNILVQGIDSRNDFSFAKSQETKVKTKAVRQVAKKESLADLLSQLGDSL